MEPEQPEDIKTDVQAQQTLLTSAQHNLEALRTLLRTGSSSVQDPEAGFTPLHAAIAACENFSTPRHNGAESNGTAIIGHSHAVSVDEQADIEDVDVKAAAKIMRLLLQNGAI